MKKNVRIFPAFFALTFFSLLLTLSCSKDKGNNNNGGGRDTTVVPPPPPPPPPVQKWFKLADSINDGQVMRYLHAGEYNGKLYLMARMNVPSGTKYGVYEFDSTSRAVNLLGIVTTTQNEYQPKSLSSAGSFISMP